MSTPTIKEPTGTVVDNTASNRWGGPEGKHAAQLLKGTHATEKIQVSAIANALPNLYYYTIFKDGTTTKARNNITGAIDFSSSTDAAVPIQSAINAIIAASASNNEQWGPVSTDKFVGGSIFIKRGVYDINSAIWVRPDLGKEITVEIVGEGRTNTFLRTGTTTNLGTVDGTAILKIGDASRAAINSGVVRDLTIINRGICHTILHLEFVTWPHISRINIWHSTGTAQANHGLRLQGAGGKPNSHVMLDHITIEDVNGAGNRYSAYLVDLPNEFVVFNHCLALGWAIGFELVHSGASVHWYSHAMNPSGTGFYINTFGSAQFYHPHVEGGGVTDKAFDIGLRDPGSRCTIIDPDITHLTASTGVAYFMEMKNQKQQINIHNHKVHTSGVIPFLFGGTNNAGAANNSYLNLFNNDFTAVGSAGTVPENIRIQGYGNRGFYTAITEGLIATPDKKQIGIWSSSPGFAIGQFAFDGQLVDTGAQGCVNDATLGKYQPFTSGANSGDDAGVRTGGTHSSTSMVRALECRFKAKLRLPDTLTNTRVFVGFKDGSGLMTSDDPSNASPCFMLAKRAADTVWHVAHNDHSGATVFTSTGVTIAQNTVYTVELRAPAGDTGFQYSINGANWSTTITSDVPPSTSGLNMHAQVETATTASKTLHLFYMIAEQISKE